MLPYSNVLYANVHKNAKCLKRLDPPFLVAMCVSTVSKLKEVSGSTRSQALGSTP